MPQGELSTRSIVTEALRNDKEVYVPYIHKIAQPTKESPASVMDMVALHSQEDFEGLQPDPWGIPTPDEHSISHRKCCLGQQRPEQKSADRSEEKSETLEIVIMPGMAFDQKLDRLGHGKGYYDRFLAQYQRSLENNPRPENQMPFLGLCSCSGKLSSTSADMIAVVGLALEEQILPEGQEVPTNASDWRLDALIAGHQAVRRRKLHDRKGCHECQELQIPRNPE